MIVIYMMINSYLSSYYFTGGLIVINNDWFMIMFIIKKYSDSVYVCGSG